MIKTFEDAGELILGTRLKKLGDRFLDDVSAVYKELDINFETTWFAVFFTLDKYGKLTMSEIAANLGVTQSAISQTLSAMEKKKLIEIRVARKDKRIKVVSLTESGIELLDRVKPIWKSIKKEMQNMLNEGRKSRYMLDALYELENAFNKKSLTKRVVEDIKNTNFRMESYKKQYFQEIKRLIFSWIFDYGLPYPEFISNLKETLKQNETYVAFSNEHITAAAIIFKSQDKNEIFIANKNDYGDRSYLFLLQNILKNKTQNCLIYVDKKKTSAKKMLKEKGYKYKKSTNFSDNSKELSIFEVVNE